MITINQIKDLARRLRGPSRDHALAELLDRLGEFAQRAGYRREGTLVRRAAADIYTGLSEPDLGGFGHDDARSRYASLESVWFKKAFNKENPPELLSQLVKVLRKHADKAEGRGREGLEDVIDELKPLMAKVQTAWQNKDKE